MAREALKRISEAEAAAEQEEKNAAAEADTIIKRAEEAASELIAAAEQRAGDMIRSKKRDAEHEAAAINEQTSAKAAGEAETIRKRAEALTERAISLITAELIR